MAKLDFVFSNCLSIMYKTVRKERYVEEVYVKGNYTNDPTIIYLNDNF